MALTGDFVCTLGPEFSMLGVFHFGTVIYAERYVSSQLQRSVRVAYIGNTVAPDVEECIAEILDPNIQTQFLFTLSHSFEQC